MHSPFFNGFNLFRSRRLPDFLQEIQYWERSVWENACLQKMLQASYWVLIMRLCSLCEALNSVETKLPIKEDKYYQGTDAATVRQ
ncbi:hypothetical protein ACQ0MK_00260 [Thalassospira lucentensis]|uniref:hypothetical protein n=1 Tax=Thalassospira lucentensis TaxID=168935 RepID=UPI003D2EFA8F